MPNVSPTRVTELIYGVFPAHALTAAMELDLFTPLDAKALTAAELAHHLDLPEPRLTILLNALVAAGLLTKTADKYANTEEAGQFLVKGKQSYMGGMYKFYQGLWKVTAKTAASIRADTPTAKRDWGSDKNELMAFFNAQYHSSYAAGKNLCQLLDLSNNHQLLDIGGGSGGVSIALCEHFAHLHATVADLPQVVELTPSFINSSTARERIDTVAIDLCEQALPVNYDIAVMRSVIQVLGPQQIAAILKNTYDSLKTDAKIIVVGRILDDSRLAPASAVAHSLVFLNTYEEGQAYTEKEYFSWLSAAGFKDPVIQYEAAKDGSSLIVAHKLADE